MLAIPLFGSPVGADTSSATPAVTPAVTPPMFNECPAVHDDTGCGFLITLNANGTATIASDSNQGPYDGNDDTLIGVVNNTGVPIPSINLTSSTDIFGFDGDGICTFTFTGDSYCGKTGDTTTYGGPINTFSNISGDKKSGTVDFDALASGSSTYFSLESNLSGANFIIPADFTVAKTVTSTGPYYAGDTSTPIDYQIAAHNFGGTTGSIVVTDQLPSNTTLVAGSDACPAVTLPTTCNQSLASGKETWVLNNVAAGATIDLTVAVTPNASTSNYTVNNTAVWEGPGCNNNPPPTVSGDAVVFGCDSPAPPVSVTAPVPITITASNTTSVYGTAGPAVTPIYSGTGFTTPPATPPVCVTTPAIVATTPVGSYPNTCSGAADPRYSPITYVAGTASVTPAPLVITASSASVTVGAAVPTITASYKGFENGDSATNLTTQPTCSTTYTTSSAAGTYPSTCTGAADPNYTISYVPGTVTATAAPATAPATTPTTAAPATPAAAPVTAPSTTPAIAFTGALLDQEWMAGVAAVLLGLGLLFMARWRRRTPKHAAGK
jgi:hypothetical protein